MSISLKSVLVLSFTLVTFIVYVYGVQIAQADVTNGQVMNFYVTTTEEPPELISSLVNGQPVRLNWGLDGPVENCRVTGLPSPLPNPMAIDTSSLQVLGTTEIKGSLEFIPTTNSSVNFNLECDLYEVPAVKNMNSPIINDLRIDGGTSKVNNSLTGRVDEVIVRWSATNATKCEQIIRVPESTGVPIIETSGSDYSGMWSVTGSWIRYDGDPRSISETTTFFVTCLNENSNTSVTEQITLNVSNPLPPEDPTVSIASNDTSIGGNEYTVTRDPYTGRATANVKWSSTNSTYCSMRALDATGNPYSLSAWSGQWRTSSAGVNISISTTTEFEITCGRDAVTIANITYPAISVTKSIITHVLMPADAGTTEVGEWDRTYLEPVAVTVTAIPNSIDKSAVYGVGWGKASMHYEYADYCIRSAHWLNGTPVNVNGWNWSGPVSVVADGNWTTPNYVTFSSTTELTALCYRTYDWNLGDPAEKALGSDTGSDTMTLVESVVADDPELHIYGNAVEANADKIWNTKTTATGYTVPPKGNPRFIENPIVATTSSSITFPFEHPYGSSDIYDIWLRACDESDGESTFSVETEDDGLVGVSYTTDKQWRAERDYCDNTTVFLKRLATGIKIDDGDLITLKCETGTDGELCRTQGLIFGAGHSDNGSGEVVTPLVDPSRPYIVLPLFWIAENVTRCNSRWAAPLSGAAGYDWWNTNRDSYSFYGGGWGNNTYGFWNTRVSTSTTYSMNCTRETDTEHAWNAFTALVPYSAVLSKSIALDTGTCKDADGSFSGTVNKVLTADELAADPWNGAVGDRGDGWCGWLMDLASARPGLKYDKEHVNPIDGTYDLVQSEIVIKNFGPGPLLSSATIFYVSILDFMEEQNRADKKSDVGSYNLGLDAPPVHDIGDYSIFTESGTLLQDFHDVIFGTHEVIVRVNLKDDDTLAVDEWNEDPANNIGKSIINLPVPRPPMSIWSDRNLVRRGESAKISWSAHTSYPMSCEVNGVGGITDTFDSSSNHYTHDHTQDHAGTGAYEQINEPTVTPLTSTGEFVLKCTEPITGTTFSETLRIEVVPDFEES